MGLKGERMKRLILLMLLIAILISSLIICSGCCYKINLERVDSACEKLLKEKNKRVMELLVEKDSLQTLIDKQINQKSKDLKLKKYFEE